MTKLENTVIAQMKAVSGHKQQILPEVVSYSHDTNKYEETQPHPLEHYSTDQGKANPKEYIEDWFQK